MQKIFFKIKSDLPERKHSKEVASFIYLYFSTILFKVTQGGKLYFRHCNNSIMNIVNLNLVYCLQKSNTHKYANERTIILTSD